MKSKIEDCKVFEIWDDTVGEKIASKTEPQSIKKNVLKVSVSDHAWLQQLQFLKEEIREKLNKRLGKEVVDSIFFQYGVVHAKGAHEPDIEEEMKKVRLTKEERTRIEESLESCGNDEIRDAAKKAMLQAAKRRKLKTGS